MRMIGTVTTEAHAQLLSDYLLTAGIEAHVEESASPSSPNGAWQVWVEHDDDLDRGAAELAAFLANPDDPKYATGRAAEKLRKQQQRDAERRRANYRDVRTSASWGGAVARYATPASMGLIGACVLIHFVGSTNEQAFLDLRYWLLFDVTPIPRSMFSDILGGQVWRLVTPMLLHGGMLHLLFNMMWMWRLGLVIESIKGTPKFVGLVLATSAISCCAQAGWYELNGTWGMFVGISGVVSGLFGYAWMKRVLQPNEGIYVTDQELGLMLTMLLLMSFGFFMDNIANAAHWGGLLSGMAIGAWPWMMRKLRSR
jgi:GlpG protein